MFIHCKKTREETRAENAENHVTGEISSSDRSNCQTSTYAVEKQPHMIYRTHARGAGTHARIFWICSFCRVHSASGGTGGKAREGTGGAASVDSPTTLEKGRLCWTSGFCVSWYPGSLTSLVAISVDCGWRGRRSTMLSTTNIAGSRCTLDGEAPTARPSLYMALSQIREYKCRVLAFEGGEP